MDSFRIPNGGRLPNPAPGSERHQVAPPPSPTGYSYVEGADDWFGSEAEEIEAMGGDPFFLDGEEGSDNNIECPEDSEGWEWDGSVDEDAHLDFE